ncbi:hypothetical protein [Flavobacterium sp.]|uniref:hypothetical protein n=1 Tax=Flavobacterium sp. TaxID=239 RepID=UPI00286A5E8B|nr:hypothetical protein [Flavobacterium sp.]
MNKILIIIFQVSFLSHLYGQKKSSDWQQMSLIGKVKKIIEIKEICPTVIDEKGKLHCHIDTINYEFDNNGYLLNKRSIDNRNTEVKIENKQKIITRYEMVDGVKKRNSEDVYNDKDLLIIQTEYYVHNKEEEILSHWEYFYNTKGQKTRQKTTSIWNGTKTIHISDYNKYGDEVKSQIFVNDDLTEDKTLKYDYKYDKKGNWINKTLVDDNETWKRKIFFY